MGKLGSLVPVLGFILGTILYLHKPQQYNFLQTIISIEMYRSGCSQKLFRWFQKLGWSKGVKGTRIAADKICSEFDQKIVSWKNEIQVELGMPAPPQQPLNVDFESSDTDSSHNSLASSGSEITNQDSSDVDFSSEDESDIVPLPFDDSLLDEPEADEQNPGYSVCWDNVQKLSMTRHHLRQENKMMLWALCFAAKNRISFRDLDTVDNTFSVTDIGLQNYLPSDTDWRILRSRMEHLVQKIVQVYFPQFSEMDVKDTPHQYTQQSQKKSEIVPIGQDRNPYQILCHGDQLSVERMVEAKLSMAFSEDAEDQLTGLVPRPQGFHKRCIILQDSMNMLFSGSTVGDKGSLCHIKNKFTFRSVKKKISDCVNSVVDFFNFVTEGCVCLIICKLLNIKNIDELSNLVPDDDKERQDMFVDLCKQVVQLSWPLIDTQSIQEVVVGEAAEDVQYHDDTIIYWDNNQILEDTLPYHEDSDNDFVDEPVAAHQESGDSVYQYSRSMLWRGLLHMAQTHAERTNNGDHIISDWRMDMVQFWNHNHNKYLILGHRLLGGVSGCLPPRLRNEVIWNSTANLTGKPGHNIALDLVNEFLNNEFKSNLKNSHGQYTDAQVSRCSHLVGSVGKSIEDIFQSDIIQDYIPKATTTDGSSRPKIKKFIDEYSGENLFEDDGERHHTGFENFEHKVGVNNPEKLKARLQKYGKSMENEEYIFKNI
ncbi:uncharacterized protein LOC125651518 [Ostrea edulis]|uniref:uncharacterized protein LOC125651518 n=1 Tax=Ostrea edulis TaxID=37623 RepID=UPI0024AFE3DB|nr:uncharacterized protein LOC125651518 [Ostrea edulis]